MVEGDSAPDGPIFGRLRARSSVWRQFANPTVLSWIEDGYPLEFAAARPPAPRRAANHSSTASEAGFVTDAVAELVATGAAVEVASAPTVVSPLGVAIRADGKRRLILDLRYVNGHLVDHPFKYERLADLAYLMPPHAWLLSCDLKSGYHHIEMHPDSWQYLGFEWSGRCYVFRVLPFGLKPACWVFTMVMKCLARRWRTRGITLLQYLDDFLFFAPTAAAARAVRQWVLADFAAAGLLLSWPKCQLEPVQRLKHLGFVIDTSTMTFEAPADRWDRLHKAVRQALAAPHVSAKAIASIVGQLMSFGLAFGRLSYMYSRALDLAASFAPHWRARIQLPAAARAELEFWLTVPQSAYTSPIRRPPLRPAFRLCTDASDHAWGAVLLDTQASASDYLPAASPDDSSTSRELEAVLHALRAFRQQLANHEVALYSDSDNTVRILEKGGSPKPHLHRLALALFHFCLEHRITLCPHWLPREDNTAADALSRRPHDNEWMLHDRFFRLIDSVLGPLTVDLFASTATRRLPRFYSEHHCPETAGVDAFRVPWRPLGRCWINPPFALLPRVLAKLRAEAADAVVLIPCWPSRPWWPLLLSDPDHWHPAVLQALLLPPAADLFVLPARAPTPVSSAPTSRRFWALRLNFALPRLHPLPIRWPM